MKQPENESRYIVEAVLKKIRERVEAGCQLTPEELRYSLEVHKSQGAEQRQLDKERDELKEVGDDTLLKILKARELNGGN